MNKQLRAKVTDLQGELTLKQTQMDSIESSLGHFASSLVKVSPKRFDLPMCCVCIGGSIPAIAEQGGMLLARAAEKSDGDP